MFVSSLVLRIDLFICNIKFLFRGETPLNCFALSPVEDDPDKSEFAWITTTTFKVNEHFATVTVAR